MLFCRYLERSLGSNTGDLLLRHMAPAGVSASCQGAVTGGTGTYKLASCSPQAASPTDAEDPNLEPHSPHPQALQIHLHRSEAGTIVSLISSSSRPTWVTLTGYCKQ